MAKGVIKKVVQDKGFGFVTNTSDGGKDVFFHISGCANRDDFDSLAVGDQVTYDIESSERGPRAVRLARAS